jgi:hypothetical protein
MEALSHCHCPQRLTYAVFERQVGDDWDFLVVFTAEDAGFWRKVVDFQVRLFGVPPDDPLDTERLKKLPLHRLPVVKRLRVRFAPTRLFSCPKSQSSAPSSLHIQIPVDSSTIGKPVPMSFPRSLSRKPKLHFPTTKQRVSSMPCISGPHSNPRNMAMAAMGCRK